jgi:hypothetical protein
MQKLSPTWIQQVIPDRSFPRIALPNAIHYSLLLQPMSRGCQVTIMIVSCQSWYIASALYVGMMAHLPHQMVRSWGGVDSDISIGWLSIQHLELSPKQLSSNMITWYDTWLPFGYAALSRFAYGFIIGGDIQNAQEQLMNHLQQS